MSAPSLRLTALHSTTISESGDELSVFLVASDGQLCNVNLPLSELASRAHVIDETHHEAQELALDVAAESRLRDAIRRFFSAVR